MTEYHIEPWFINIFNELYRNRTFKISNTSEVHPFPNGICQGSALSSLLFSLFINSIGNELDCEYLLYADELVIYTHGTSCNELAIKLANNLQKKNSMV